MDTTSVAYVLCRIEDDSSLTPVSRHGDILTGIAAGGYAVEVEDFDFAYALYSGDPSNGSSTRVASFREGRIGYRTICHLAIYLQPRDQLVAAFPTRQFG